LQLTDRDRALAAGDEGEARAFAFEVLEAYATALGVSSFLDISQAHVDGCLYHGQASLDFVERLVRDGGRVAVPTSLNVGSVDLIHPGLIRDPDLEQAGRRLMEAHVELGCERTFSCAPYQSRRRPLFGQQIAWGESNAIVFANSVIGARTERYGDFLDLCCAMTGRAPAYGLHLEENRGGEVLFRLGDDVDFSGGSDAPYVALGALAGDRCAGRIPVFEGLPATTTEDNMKALGAVAASTGAIAMLHAIGVTPEAPTLREAFKGREPRAIFDVGKGELGHALVKLSTARDGDKLAAVSLGTPHFSMAEFEALAAKLVGFRPAPGVAFYVNTSRETLAEIAKSNLKAKLEAAGVLIVADTCVYVTAILDEVEGAVMTNSGKMAHYAPGNLNVDIAFGTLDECLASATAGRVVRLGL